MDLDRQPGGEVTHPLEVHAVGRSADADEVQRPVAQAPVRTAAGLVKRVPRSSAAATPETRPSGEAPVARTQRSPEEVRAMLSRYRSGLHRGRDVESPSGDGSN